MTTLEKVIDELKGLPPTKLEQAATYVHGLKEEVHKRRLVAIKASAGCLKGAVGESFEKAISEGCERINEGDG